MKLSIKSGSDLRENTKMAARLHEKNFSIFCSSPRFCCNLCLIPYYNFFVLTRFFAPHFDVVVRILSYWLSAMH
jgi:hypothetical protein